MWPRGCDVFNRPRFEMFQVEDAELVGPKALLFLQLLIAFITRSAVNVRAISNGFLLLLFAMIRSVVKSFKVPGVEVVASRMSNEAALTRMIHSTQKKLGHT